MARIRNKHNAPKGSTKEKGDVLEKIISEMHDVPGVKVERNIFLPSRDGGGEREIDVLITSEVAGYPVRIAIECKNENKPTGIAKIGEFIDKLNDVSLPVQLGIFVSTNRYESGAIRRAKAAGVKLFRLDGIKNDLSQAVKDAFQSKIYLLLTITSIAVSNNIADESAPPTDILFFRGPDGEICGSVPDLVWKEWKSGHLPNKIGNYEISLSLPTGWKQVVNGKIAKVGEIKVNYEITGYAISFPGTVNQYNFVNIEDNRVEKSQIVANFSSPPGKYPIIHLKTENELTEFKNQVRDGFNMYIGRFLLPRIKWLALYWPPSKMATEKLNKKMKDAMLQGKDFDFSSISLSEIEGDDLSAIWDPIIEHPAYT